MGVAAGLDRQCHLAHMPAMALASANVWQPVPLGMGVPRVLHFAHVRSQETHPNLPALHVCTQHEVAHSGRCHCKSSTSGCATSAPLTCTGVIGWRTAATAWVQRGPQLTRAPARAMVRVGVRVRVRERSPFGQRSRDCRCGRAVEGSALLVTRAAALTHQAHTTLACTMSLGSDLTACWWSELCVGATGCGAWQTATCNTEPAHATRNLLPAAKWKRRDPRLGLPTR